MPKNKTIFYFVSNKIYSGPTDVVANIFGSEGSEIIGKDTYTLTIKHKVYGHETGMICGRTTLYHHHHFIGFVRMYNTCDAKTRELNDREKKKYQRKPEKNMSLGKIFRKRRKEMI